MDCFVAMPPCLPRSKFRILPAWTGLTAHSLQFSKSNATAAFHVKGKDAGTCIQGHVIQCILTKVKDSSTPILHNLEREPHKYFDHVVITVRSGDGGHGAVLNMPRPRMQVKSPGRKKQEKEKRKGSYRRDPDGSLILPMGGHGGDVVLYADESKDSLLELHQIRRYNAKRGGNVDAMGVLSPMLHDGFRPPTLRIPVPVGTVVKRKRGGKLLADLAHPGDQILVAKGGRGGISLVETSPSNRSQLRAVNVNVMRDKSDKVMVFGQPGEEVTVELILRIVADVGLVELFMYNPNYLERPHMVVLNKLDLPEAKERFDSISKQIERIGSVEDVPGGAHMLVEGNNCEEGEACVNSEEDSPTTSLKQEKKMEDYSPPIAVVGISALKGIGIVHMLKQIRLALEA